jgi:hypothetical protein
MVEEKEKKEEGVKKVDGVVKLSQREIKESRRIVLETIREAKEEKQEPPAPKKVDGVVKAASKKKIIGFKTKIFNLKSKPESSVKIGQKKEIVGPATKIKKTTIPKPIAVSTAKDKAVKEKLPSEKNKKIWREEIKKILSKKRTEKDKQEVGDKVDVKIASKTVVSAESKEKPKKRAAKASIQPVMDIVKRKLEKKEKKLVKPISSAVPADDFISPQESLGSKISLVNPFRNEVIQQRIKEKEKRLAAEATRKLKDRRVREKEELKRQILAKQKKKEEARRKEREKKRRAQKKKERAKARRKKIVEFKKKMKQNVVIWRTAGLQALRWMRTVAFFAVIFGAILYSFILIVVLRFGVDNTIFRKISVVVPLPAIITQDGVIEYYNYRDMLATWQMQTGRKLTPEEIKIKLAERLVLIRLCRKYGVSVPDATVSNETLVRKLHDKVIRDKGINQVGLNRIKKIKQLIDREGQFIKIAAKYGDKVGQITVGNDNINQFNYGAAVKNMQPGEISDIIFAPEGYYIFRCYDRDINGAALSYVFVRAKTLTEYLSEAIAGYRIISLVKDH